MKEATDNHIKNSLDPIYSVFFFTTIFSFCYYLFFRQSQAFSTVTIKQTFQFLSDFPNHLNFINRIVAGKMITPEVGFQKTIYYIARLLHVSYPSVGVMILSLAVTLSAYIICRFLKNFTRLNNTQALFFTFVLIVLSMICDPFFVANLYVAQGTPNIWHNPPSIMVKPFILLVVFLSLYALNNHQIKYYILTSILLFVSFWYKPSFGIVFIPALGVYLVFKHTMKMRYYFYYIMMILPSVLYSLYQLLVLEKYGLYGAKSPIVFAPFAVLHLYSPNILVSLLLGLAFPLALLFSRFKQVFQNDYLFLSWLVTLCGYMQFALFAQSGAEFVQANFAWGYFMSLSPLFVFSVIEFVNWICDVNLNMKNKIKIIPITTLLALHFTSGVFYFLRILTGHTYL